MKHRYFLLAIATAIAFTQTSFAQKSSGTFADEYFRPFFIGAGFGLEYGGFGVNLEYQPSEHLGIFGGVGYNLVMMGGNAGVTGKLLPRKSVCPTFTVMYGYNAVLQVKNSYGTPILEQNYYGVTLQPGAEVRAGDMGRQKIRFGIGLPFRSDEFHQHYDRLKSQGVTFKPDILPITASIGYHVGLGSRKRPAYED